MTEERTDLVEQVNELVEAINALGGFGNLLEANWGEGLRPLEKLSIDVPHETTDLHDALIKITKHLKEMVFRTRRMASEMLALRKAIGLPTRHWTGEPRESP